jgi:hypothetical protein
MNVNGLLPWKTQMEMEREGKGQTRAQTHGIDMTKQDRTGRLGLSFGFKTGAAKSHPDLAKRAFSKLE